MFQSVNAFAVMLCGMVLAWLVKENIKGNRTVRIWGNSPRSGANERRVLHSDFGARWSAVYGPLLHAADGTGLAVMGFAETVYRPGCDVAKSPGSKSPASPGC